MVYTGQIMKIVTKTIESWVSYWFFMTFVGAKLLFGSYKSWKVQRILLNFTEPFDKFGFDWKCKFWAKKCAKNDGLALIWEYFFWQLLSHCSANVAKIFREAQGKYKHSVYSICSIRKRQTSLDLSWKKFHVYFLIWYFGRKMCEAPTQAHIKGPGPF